MPFGEKVSVLPALAVSVKFSVGPQDFESRHSKAYSKVPRLGSEKLPVVVPEAGPSQLNSVPSKPVTDARLGLPSRLKVRA